MIFQNCIGLDIRSDRFHLVAVRSGLRGSRVVAHTRGGYDRHLGAADKVRTIGEAAGELILTHGLADAEICLLLPGELFIVREIRLPLAAKENLRTTLSYGMQKYVPLPAADIYFDYLIAEENKAQNTLHILLFVIRKTDLEGYLALQDYLGKRFSGVVPMPCAVAGFMARLLGKDFSTGRVGFVRTGSTDGEVSIFSNGRLAFTRNFSRAAGGPERVDDQWGAALGATLESHGAPQSGLKWFFCHDSDAPSPQSLLTEKWHLDATLLDGRDLGLPSADLLPAYGLALESLKAGPSRVNLLPPALRRNPDRSGAIAMAVLALLVLLLAAAWGGSAVVRNRMAVSRLDTALAQLRRDVAVVEDSVEKNGRMEERLQQISALAGNRTSMLALLQELSGRLPLSAYIQEFNFNKDGVQIAGLADSATELLAVIEESPLFDRAVFLATITRTKDGKEQFRIGMGIQR